MTWLYHSIISLLAHLHARSIKYRARRMARRMARRRWKMQLEQQNWRWN